MATKRARKRTLSLSIKKGKSLHACYWNKVRRHYAIIEMPLNIF
jgi:hypothetical protein